MKVLIDGSPLVNRATGIATYLVDAIRAMVKYIPQWELILALPAEIHPSVEGLPLEKIRVVKAPLPFIKMRLPWVLIKLPWLVRKYNADLLWSPNKILPLTGLKNCKTLITTHDVVWKEFQETTNSKGFSRFYNWIIDRSLEKADYVWHNSEYTKTCIEKYYPNLKLKPNIVGISCSTRFRKIEVNTQVRADIFNEYKIHQKYILFVGSLEPRKNLRFLIGMMPIIYKKTGCQLLIVGARGWKNNDIKEIVLHPDFNKESVVFADYVSVDKLILLYNLATCYISTALNEGFGLPQLEAMNCECPVISPNNSAMIEVVSGRGILIDGWNENTWIETICSTLNNEDLLLSLKHPDIVDFSWKNIINNLYNIVCENNES